MQPTLLLGLLVITFALILAVSIAVLVGNSGSSSGSCCLPSSCSTSLLVDMDAFRPKAVNGICQLSSEVAAQLGCPTAATDLIGTTCVVKHVEVCAQQASMTLVSDVRSYVRTAGILGVLLPCSPVIGVLFIIFAQVALSLLSCEFGSTSIKYSYRSMVGIIVLTTFVMFIATAVFAGRGYHQLASSPGFLYHTEPVQACSSVNVSTGLCTNWTAVLFESSASNVCPVASQPAAIFAGMLFGNVRIPISILYFISLIIFGVIVVVVGVRIAVQVGEAYCPRHGVHKRLQALIATLRRRVENSKLLTETFSFSSNNDDAMVTDDMAYFCSQRNNKSFVAAATDCGSDFNDSVAI